jgi:hypothetical protein
LPDNSKLATAVLYFEASWAVTKVFPLPGPKASAFIGIFLFCVAGSKSLPRAVEEKVALR